MLNKKYRFSAVPIYCFDNIYTADNDRYFSLSCCVCKIKSFFDFANMANAVCYYDFLGGGIDRPRTLYAKFLGIVLGMMFRRPSAFGGSLTAYAEGGSCFFAQKTRCIIRHPYVLRLELCCSVRQFRRGSCRENTDLVLTLKGGNIYE